MRDDVAWRSASHDGFYAYFLPKSEYRLCDPPDKWVDVTEHCDAALDGFGNHTICVKGGFLMKAEDRLLSRKSFRIRKAIVHHDGIPCHAFIVEKKEES